MGTKRRKRFNKIVKVLSEVYNREYKEVERLYYKMDSNVANTKMALNLTNYERNS